MISKIPFKKLISRLPSLPFPFHFSSDQSSKQNFDRILKEEREKFAELMKDGSDNALKMGVKMLGDIEVDIQLLQEKSTRIEDEVEKFPSSDKLNVKKVFKINQAIEEQEKLKSELSARAEKQIQNKKLFAITSIAKEVIEVSDSLKNCLHHSQNQASDSTKFKVEEANERLRKIFESFRIKEFDPIGEEYDSNKQEALYTVDGEEEKSGKVAKTLRTGFMINDRLLRSAHVAVYK